jgi:hypothetical protein
MQMSFAFIFAAMEKRKLDRSLSVARCLNRITPLAIGIMLFKKLDQDNGGTREDISV